LTDGKEHTVTFEVYGASYSGGFLRSNPVVVRFPARTALGHDGEVK
jgi:hypothetical protein